MYILPGYVSYIEADGAIYVASSLLHNKIKITDPSMKNEFQKILRDNGCMELSTPLTKFLHEQELLESEAEIKNSLQRIEDSIKDTFIVTIMPTEGCNFRCPYCYETHKSEHMSRRTLDCIQLYLTKEIPNYKTVQLNWFGGEPTLCKDTILETSYIFQTLQYQYGFKYVADITTNGYLLNKNSFLDYYNAGITSFQITLDGWTHDQTRPHVNGSGTLDKILDNLVEIATLPQEQYSFNIILRHNILDESVDYSWYDYLYKLFGADKRFSILVRFVGDWGGDTVHKLKLLSEEAQERLLHKYISYLHKIGMKCANDKNHILSKSCYARYPHSMVFRANGAIEKCTVCLDDPHNLLGTVDPTHGIILDEKVNNLWGGAQLKPECYTCSDILYCFNMNCKKQAIINEVFETEQCPMYTNKKEQYF